MIDLKIIGKDGKAVNILIAEEWNELTAAQLPKVAVALLDSVNDTRRKIRLVQALTGLTDKRMLKIMPEVMQEQLFPLVAWVEESLSLTKQLFSKIEMGGLALYGPKSELLNLRLSEWHFAETALFDWFEEGERTEALARLCAVLYRPAVEDYNFVLDVEGDCRIPFNANVLSYWSAFIAKHWPLGLQLAVLLYYRGCRTFITENYRGVFGENKSEKARAGEPGYFDLMRAIAKTGIYGDFEKVEQMYIGTALYELKCAMEEVAALKKANG